MNIISTFNAEQIDYLVNLYQQHKYDFDTVLKSKFAYENLPDTISIVTAAIQNTESKLQAIKIIRDTIGCDILTAKSLVDTHYDK